MTVVSRRALLHVGAAAAVGAGMSEATQPAAPVTLGQVSLTFYAVVGAVVHEVLERLGHAVTVREGSHEQVFPLLGAGDVDLMVAAWLPEGHAAYWQRYGADAVEVATLYDDARFFWAVPRYVPEADVASMADLARPSVAARMTTAIQSIGAGAAITQRSQAAIVEYGLASAGYQVRTGTAAEWIAAHAAAVAERRWIVFPTWAPQYLNRDGGLRPLADPRRVLGGGNRGVIVAPRARFQALPRRTREVLSRITLGIDGVTEMDWMVNAGGMAPRAAARAWMQANDGRVRAWLQP